MKKRRFFGGGAFFSCISGGVCAVPRPHRLLRQMRVMPSPYALLRQKGPYNRRKRLLRPVFLLSLPFYQGKPSFSPERLSVVFSVREYSGKKKKKASSFRRAERKGRLIKKAEGRNPPPVTLMLQITPSCRRIPNSEAAPDPALQKEPLPQTTRSCSCPAYRNPWRTGPHGFSGRWPRLPEPWPEVRYFP